LPITDMLQENAMLKMLIAVDGSEYSQRALEAVARLVPQSDAQTVVLLNVREGPLFYGELPPYDYESIDRAQVKRQQDLLAAAAAQAKQLGLKQVSTQAEQGAAATEIVRVADALGVDQIVMGTHGRGAIGSLFLGSVAQRVVNQARMPVLLVK
jgi:nucleotide-binding universal stress UspA family protein